MSVNRISNRRRRWDRRFYRTHGETFMQRGGIHGRCRSYPLRFWGIRRVFRTCIHIRDCPHNFTRRSENTRAFNSHNMVPLFAYQLRPMRRPIPPGPRKRVVQEQIEPQMQWRQAA